MNKEENKDNMTEKELKLVNKNKKIISKEKSLSSKEILCKDIQGSFLLVRVGNNEKAASGEAIKEIQRDLTRLFEENNINCVTFVTHHAVSIDIIK